MNGEELYHKVTEWFSANMETAGTELHYDTPFHLLIAVILSAQCTDKRVNMHTPQIFTRFPEPSDLASASFDEVYDLIKSISFPNNKAKHLIGMASRLVSVFDSKVPAEPELLETLPGILPAALPAALPGTPRQGTTMHQAVPTVRIQPTSCSPAMRQRTAIPLATPTATA